MAKSKFFPKFEWEKKASQMPSQGTQHSEPTFFGRLIPGLKEHSLKEKGENLEE